MTKDVIISISGLQYVQDGTEMEPIEMVAPGEYYYKNGHHYLLFDEVTEGFDEVTHNFVKFREKEMEVRKKGLVNVDMLFIPDKKTVSCYRTPMGMMSMGITATGFRMLEAPNIIDMTVAYALDFNENYVADCTIHMNIKSRENGHFRLS